MSVNEKGLTEQTKFDEKAKLRQETDEKSQRPVAQTKSVKSDRGTFKDKC